MEMNKIINILKSINGEIDFKQREDFFKDGLLDSLELMKLVSMLEETYNIEIDGEDILPENLCNIDAIWNLVEKSNK